MGVRAVWWGRVAVLLLVWACQNDTEQRAAGGAVGSRASASDGSSAGATAQAGTSAGGVAGAMAGTLDGGSAGVNAGTSAGVSAGASAGVNAGTSAGVSAGTSAGVSAGATAGSPGPPVFDAGSDPDRNAVLPGMICERLSTIQCAGETYCCPNPGRDFDSCLQTMRSGCLNELYLDAIAMQANAGFDATAAELAFAEFERLASLCDLSIAAFGEAPGGLRSMLAGTVAPGGSCRTLGAEFDPVLGGAALASCTDAARYTCLPSLIEWTCTQRAATGAECFVDENCAAGNYCTSADPAIAGSCAARKPTGQACTGANQCERLFCQGGLCVEPSVEAAYCLL